MSMVTQKKGWPPERVDPAVGGATEAEFFAADVATREIWLGSRDRRGWLDGHPPVLTGTSENNHGPANIGQVKWMATEALRALDAASPQLAADIRLDLNGTSPSNRIVDLTEPDLKTPEWIENQKAPLLVGQLKPSPRLFYNRLNTISLQWVLDQIQQKHDGSAILGTDYWRVTGKPNYTENGYFPWTPTLQWKPIVSPPPSANSKSSSALIPP